jgi:hypothetical protein
MPVLITEEIENDKDGGEDNKDKDKAGGGGNSTAALEGSGKRKSKYAKLLEQLGGNEALDNDLTALYANLQTVELAPAGDPLSGKSRSPAGLRKSSTMTGGGLTSPGRSPVVALQPGSTKDGQAAAASLASMTARKASFNRSKSFSVEALQG